MSILGNILAKIFRPNDKPATPAPAASNAPSPASSPPASAQPASAEPPPQAATQVDVGAVLETMAAMKDNGGGNYQSSIVDLLKLLDLDSSLSARTELARELGVRAGEDGSSEQNIALHRAVIKKLAEHGGIVPDSLRG